MCDGSSPETGRLFKRQRCAVPRGMTASADSGTSRNRQRVPQANRRSRDVRVDNVLDRDFGDFSQPIQDNFIPDASNCSLRVVVANHMFPDYTTGRNMGTLKISSLRMEYACGDAPEKVLQISP